MIDAAREMAAAVGIHRGHFRYESGDHGDLWIDLDRLLTDASNVERWTAELHRRVGDIDFDAVCGPLAGGAFVACFLAAKAGKPFTERHVRDNRAVTYTLGEIFAGAVRDRRVLLVDDAINAASAVRSSATALADAGARVVGIASLIACAGSESIVIDSLASPLRYLLRLDRTMWPAAICPLCASRVALTQSAEIL